MDIKYETGSVVGIKSDTHWAQVVKTHHAFGVLEIEDESGQVQLTGMRLMHALNELISEPITSIQSLFKEIDSLCVPVVQSLILCVPLEDSIAVILRGSGIVYLKRDGHITRLKSREGTISGKVKAGDILFLSSKTCLNGISEEEFFTFFDHLDVEEIAEKLTIHLHKLQESVGYAGLFIAVKGGEKNSDVREIQAQDASELNAVKTTSSFSHIPSKFFSVRTNVFHALNKKRKRLKEVFSRTEVRITTILIALFFISIGFGLLKERTAKTSVETYKTVEQGKQLLEEGKALLSLNAVKSREKLLEAKQLVTAAQKAVSPKTKEGRMLEDLEKSIDDVLPQAAKEFTITPELFFDVSLLKAGSTISSFGLYEDTMAFLDNNSKTVFSLQLSTKNGQIVGGGGQLDSSESVAIHGDSVYVYTPNGIHVLSIKDKTIKPLVIKKASEWLNIKSMNAFAGNVYLLDIGKSRIWKYVATGSAFTELREFLLPDFFPDLTNAQNMSIDGSVWLGSNNGIISKFTQGGNDVCLPRGVEPPLGNQLWVFTDDNTEKLYVLDSQNSRVVVLEKDGMYNAQYKYPPTFTPRQIAVSEKLQKLFFFSDGKLYTTPLQ